MSEVVIIQMSRDDLSRLFDQKIEAVKQDLANANDKYSSVLSHNVDRKYLRRNFKWGKTRIERFEAEGRLVPQFTGDAKSHHYKLSDCVRLYDELNA